MGRGASGRMCVSFYQHFRINQLWWLILSVNLAGLKDAEIAGVSGEDEQPRPNQLRARTEKAEEGQSCGLCWSWDIHLLQLSGITSTLPILWIPDSDQDIPSANCQAFRLGLSYTTGFPGSPACRQQIIGLLSSVSARANAFKKTPYIYIFIHSLLVCFSGEP